MTNYEYYKNASIEEMAYLLAGIEDINNPELSLDYMWTWLKQEHNEDNTPNTILERHQFKEDPECIKDQENAKKIIERLEKEIQNERND